MSSLVTVRNLTKYSGPFPAVKNISFDVEQGKIIGLLGPNGCGKTTTIKILAGIINQYTGDVKIDGHKPGIESKNIISYLPEKTYLSDWMKAKDAIDFFNDFYSDFDRNKAMEMLERFQLGPNMQIKAMSKGMQEKMQLVLVMSRNAKLYLLDEPLGGVDPATRGSILDIILNNYTENSSLLLSTHLIYDVERIFDSVVMMGFGEIFLADTVDNIRQNTGKSVDEYFREVFRC